VRLRFCIWLRNNVIAAKGGALEITELSFQALRPEVCDSALFKVRKWLSLPSVAVFCVLLVWVVGPRPITGFLHRHGLWPPAAAQEVDVPAPMTGGPEQKASTGGTEAKRKPAGRYDEYQVPAGGVIAVTIRTTVSSASTFNGDQVDATLSEGVTRDGVELIPAGSVMHGTVVDAVQASPEELRGRIAVAFFVIEHAVTGSRAAIKTRIIAVDAPVPAEKKPKPVDVELIAGQTLNVVLAEPLLIHIPK
jgi:hypothetical protein